MTELTKKEITDYYDSFYAEDDFRYYPRGATERIIGGILLKARIVEEAKVLDLGCGTGFYTSVLRELGCQATGVDISAVAIKRAATLHPDSPFMVGDATRLPVRRDYFDLILSLGVSVMNTRDTVKLHSYVQHLMRCLKPGGVLVFIGGSDLRGGQSAASSWTYHTWKEIKEFIPAGSWKINGPYLSHFRLLASLPALSINRVMTFALRMLPFALVRSTLFFVTRNHE